MTPRTRQRERVAASFDILVGQMVPSLAEMDPVPYAIVQQAQRRAALRTELLASGAYTYRALAEGRGMTGASLRQWVRRARERHELFTVDHDNESLVPALLLDADLAPRPEFRQVIDVLTEAGEDGWSLWAWLVHPTPWLDGTVPAVLLFQAPEAVLDAARRRASNAA
jgi:transposase-like protein